MTLCPAADAAQSVVAFGAGAYAQDPYILKFFAVRVSFDTELALRANGALAPLMPRIRSVHDPLAPPCNNMPIADRWGRVLPPCIVMSHGESLADWLKRATPDIFQAVAVRCLLPSNVEPSHVCLQLAGQTSSCQMWPPRSSVWHTIGPVY